MRAKTNTGRHSFGEPPVRKRPTRPDSRRGALCASLALMAMGHPAHAQNSPLSGLAPRGAVQASDIIPIMPAGGAQLMQTTVGAIIAPASAGATGTVQSVNLALPGAFTCDGGPITTSGTINCALANESANTFLAGPTSGSAAAPTFRAIAINDLFGGAGASGSTFLRGDGTWAAAGSGSVSSVGLSLPGVFTVSGSPVTGSGTLTGAFISENSKHVPCGARMVRTGRRPSV